MKVAASVESLWQYIQSLSLSERNRKWLATKLLENNYTKEDESEFISKDEILAGIDNGLKELAERKRTGRKAKTLEELIHEL